MREPWVEEWIDNLKEGDKVIVTTGGYYAAKEVKEVEKITPSGLIKVDGYLYKQNGYKRGGSPRRLIEATDEAILQIEHETKIRKCFSVMANTQKLSYEQAVAIIGILEGE